MSTAFTYSLTRSDNGAAIPAVEVIAFSDAGMALAVAQGVTDAFGDVTLDLDDGDYYFRRRLSGWAFTNPDPQTVTAVTSITGSGTGLPIATDGVPLASDVFDQARLFLGDDQPGTVFEDPGMVKALNLAGVELFDIKRVAFLQADMTLPDWQTVTASTSELNVGKDWVLPLAHCVAALKLMEQGKEQANQGAAYVHLTFWAAALGRTIKK